MGPIPWRTDEAACDALGHAPPVADDFHCPAHPVGRAARNPGQAQTRMSAAGPSPALGRDVDAAGQDGAGGGLRVDSAGLAALAAHGASG
jgi:hypothetical protein